MRISLQNDPLLGWTHYVYAESVPGIVEAGETVRCDSLHRIRLAGIASVEVTADPWEAYADNIRADYRAKHDKPRWRTR